MPIDRLLRDSSHMHLVRPRRWWLTSVVVAHLRSGVLSLLVVLVMHFGVPLQVGLD